MPDPNEGIWFRGDDVAGIGDQDFMNETLEKAVNVTVKASGGSILYPTNESYDPVIERISRGILVGIGEDSDKGTIYASLGYKGKFDLVKNTNYEITISVDLGRLSDYTPDDSDPFTDLAMLRLLNLDFIRVEKQALNPLTTDADGDSLTDGEESGWDGFPNTNDADRDGLTDYQELVTHGTNPQRRDSDGDGVRDGVELGKSSSFFSGQGTPTESFGSWTERLARYGTPFQYDFISNYDADPDQTPDFVYLPSFILQARAFARAGVQPANERGEPSSLRPWTNEVRLGR